ncbi:hypothetical protein B0H14DRAFT_2618466 [Mycena olivaceomarginata]|nr:hypothetical protein B0H14DRAFT_2618466 [Mycena olivaceomarginata]
MGRQTSVSAWWVKAWAGSGLTSNPSPRQVAPRLRPSPPPSHRQAAPVILGERLHPALPTSPTAPASGTVKAPHPKSLSTPASPPISPTAPSFKLLRFLQSPTNRDRSKSFSIDRPPSAASSSASHATSTSNTSNSTSTSSASGRRSATRFLGLGKDKDARERERERQRICGAARGAPSAAGLL